MSTNPDDYEGQTVLILGRGKKQNKKVSFSKFILRRSYVRKISSFC